MGLLFTVVGASQVEQLALAAVVSSHKQRTADGVGANLVPKSLDAVVRGLSVVEVGVGEVEADIHDAHHHVLACVGLRQTRSCIDGQRIQVDGHRVHQRMCAAPSLDAIHVAFLRKSPQPVGRNGSNVDVARLCQLLAAVLTEYPFGIIGDADEGTHGRSLALSHHLSEHRREFMQLWTLCAGRHHGQKQHKKREYQLFHACKVSKKN